MTGSQLIRGWVNGHGARSAHRWQAWLPRLATWMMVLVLAYMLADPGSIDWKEYSLFGREPAPGTAATVSVARAPTVRSRPVVLTLYGTAATSAQEDALAVIAVKGGAPDIFHVGDELQEGVTLKSVGPWSVVVMAGNSEQEVFLVESQNLMRATHGERDTLSPPGLPGDPAENRISAPDVVRQIQEYRAAITDNPASLASKLRIYAVNRENAVYGFRLRPGTDRDLLGHLGLESGDVLLAVNGLPVNVKENLPGIMTQLRDQNEFLLEFERGGRRQEIKVVMETGE